MSLFWSELFKLQGTHLKMSTAHHPETDGQSEALNKCVEKYLRCFCFEQPKSWSQWLHWAEYWYNISYQTAAGMTPFEAVYGRKPPTLIKFLPGETEVAAVSQALVDRDELLRQLKYNLERAQQLMTKYANKSRRELGVL